MDKHLFDDLVRSMEEFNKPGWVVFLTERRMEELLETERKHEKLKKVLAILAKEEGV